MKMIRSETGERVKPEVGLVAFREEFVISLVGGLCGSRAFLTSLGWAKEVDEGGA